MPHAWTVISTMESNIPVFHIIHQCRYLPGREK